jgi:hypothetical protein
MHGVVTGSVIYVVCDWCVLHSVTARFYITSKNTINVHKCLVQDTYTFNGQFYSIDISASGPSMCRRLQLTMRPYFGEFSRIH